MNCDVDHRCSSDPVLLWLWHRLTTKAPIRPLAWEPPRCGPKKPKKKKNPKIRNDFNEPRPLHLPIQREALNSLTWAIWFSLINSSLWYSDYLGFVAKTYTPWLLRAISEAALWLKSSGRSPNETEFSTLRLCVFFIWPPWCRVSHAVRVLQSGSLCFLRLIPFSTIH